MSRAELSQTLNAAREAKFTRDQITPGMKQVATIFTCVGMAVGSVLTLAVLFAVGVMGLLVQVLP